MIRRSVSPAVDLIPTAPLATPRQRSIEARRIRKNMLLRMLRDNGPLSRTDLARLLDFNYRSTSLLVDELISRGLVFEEKSHVDQGRGRPPQPIRLNEQAATVMGVALDSTGGEAMLMDLAGRPVAAVSRRDWIAESSAARVQLAQVLAAGIEQSHEGPMPPLAGIGVVMSHVVESVPAMGGDPLRGVRQTPSEDVCSVLSKAWNVPVFIESPARAKALASRWFGVGRRFNTLAYLDLDERPGLGVLMGDQLVRGADGLAGEISLLPAFCPNGQTSHPLELNALSAILSEIAVFFNPEAIIVGSGRKLAEKEAGGAATEGISEACLRAAFESRFSADQTGPLARTAVHVCDLGGRALGLGAVAIVLQRIFHPSPCVVATKSL
ncbi:MAG: hypothetical protein Kow0059_11720 [Candidatus Sumerlaeia bacterium]